ncbi:MAG: hypothetical protein FWE03_04380 [Firmicutes bacterium]|nr:hypothetical protein [Bacillota bacterium]
MGKKKNAQETTIPEMSCPKCKCNFYVCDECHNCQSIHFLVSVGDKISVRCNECDECTYHSDWRIDCPECNTKCGAKNLEISKQREESNIKRQAKENKKTKNSIRTGRVCAILTLIIMGLILAPWVMLFGFDMELPSFLDGIWALPAFSVALIFLWAIINCIATKRLSHTLTLMFGLLLCTAQLLMAGAIILALPNAARITIPNAPEGHYYMTLFNEGFLSELLLPLIHEYNNTVNFFSAMGINLFFCILILAAIIPIFCGWVASINDRERKVGVLYGIVSTMFMVAFLIVLLLILLAPFIALIIDFVARPGAFAPVLWIIIGIVFIIMSTPVIIIKIKN